jgi:dolichyl-phosphate-mannose-protein mannosyltransferase
MAKKRRQSATLSRPNGAAAPAAPVRAPAASPRPRRANGSAVSGARRVEPAPAQPPAPIDWRRLDSYLLAGFVVAALLLYSWRLGTPDGFVFDEVYHAFTAQQLAQGNTDAYLWDKTPPPGVAYEWTHPALSKLIMQVGIFIFGDNEIGWRSMSALFGAMGIGLVFSAGRLMFNRLVGVFAAALLMLDGMWYVQARIGMNDQFLTFFIFASYVSLFFYLRRPAAESRRYLWITGALLGLAMATKWSAVYSLGAIGLVVAVREGRLLLEGRSAAPFWKVAVTVGGAFAAVPVVIYLGAYVQFFGMGHSIAQWRELQQQMYWYHSGLTATHAWASRWWTWPLMLKPVWYYVTYTPETVAQIFSMGNPLIWWAFLPAVAFALFDWQDKARRSIGLGLVLLGFFSQWLPWFLSPRISFAYHFMPCLPFGVLAVGYALDRLRAPRVVLLGYFLPVLVAFVYFFPLYSAWPISKDYAEQHYWMPGWKPR